MGWGMKAFEAWYAGELIEHEKGYCMIAWRAALEWFYDKLGHSEEHGELKDLINKELEDK